MRFAFRHARRKVSVDAHGAHVTGQLRADSDDDPRRQQVHRAAAAAFRRRDQAVRAIAPRQRVATSSPLRDDARLAARRPANAAPTEVQPTESVATTRPVSEATPRSETMKILLVVPIVVAMSLAAHTVPPAAPAEDATWVVDPVHSSVVFKIKHANCASFYGLFRDLEGTITEATEAEDCKVVLKIDADSIDARHPDRNKHLRSPDFFDVEQFPTIAFTSTKVVAKGAELEVTGDLEMHGEKKSITAVARKTGEGEFQGKRAGFETTLTIKRTDFGMDYGIADKVLGDEVELMISLECVPAE
jgi:polyisoprenoid-binding protein YceI